MRTTLVSEREEESRFEMTIQHAWCRLVWGSGEFVCEGDARSIFNQLEYKPYDHWQSDVEHKTVGCGIAESKVGTYRNLQRQHVLPARIRDHTTEGASVRLWLSTNCALRVIESLSRGRSKLARSWLPQCFDVEPFLEEQGPSTYISIKSVKMRNSLASRLSGLWEMTMAIDASGPEH